MANHASSLPSSRPRLLSLRCEGKPPRRNCVFGISCPASTVTTRVYSRSERALLPISFAGREQSGGGGGIEKILEIVIRPHFRQSVIRNGSVLEFRARPLVRLRFLRFLSEFLLVDHDPESRSLR